MELSITQLVSGGVSHSPGPQVPWASSSMNSQEAKNLSFIRCILKKNSKKITDNNIGMTRHIFFYRRNQSNNNSNRIFYMKHLQNASLFQGT